MGDIVVGPVPLLARASAASAAFAASEAATVDREKSATIRKYEATAAIVCHVCEQNQK